jgi:hypothetical protein
MIFYWFVSILSAERKLNSTRSRNLQAKTGSRIFPWLLSAYLGLVGLPVKGAESKHTLTDGELSAIITVDSKWISEKFGPRFDRTGAVTSLSRGGVEYVAAIGLADEFGLDGVGTLGFAEAGREGGSFYKVGVGELSRYSEDNYIFWVGYPVRALFPLSVTDEGDGRSLAITQESPNLYGYAYRYRKSYRLEGGETLVISYELENTGEKTFTVSHYNHNWLRFSDAEIDSDYRVTPAFAFSGLPTAGLTIDDRGLGLSCKAQGAYWAFDSRISPDQNRLVVRRRDHALELSGDFEASRFALWIGEGGFCPEIFGLHTVMPGEVSRWQRVYRILSPRSPK